MFPKISKPGCRTAPQACTRIVMALTMGFAVLAPAVQAQQAKPAAATDPADPQAKVQPFRYIGALSSYRALQDLPAASWQEINEKTNKVGGWRTYAREKLSSDDGAASPQAQKPAPAAKAQDAGKAKEGHASH